MKVSEYFKATAKNPVSVLALIKKTLMSPAEDSLDKTLAFMVNQQVDFANLIKRLNIKNSFDTIIFDLIIRSVVLNKKLTASERFKELFLALAYVQQTGSTNTHIYPVLDAFEDLAISEDTDIDLIFLVCQSLHSFTTSENIDIVVYAEEGLERVLKEKEVPAGYKAKTTEEYLSTIFEDEMVYNYEE